jgi:DNA-binding PadR family transcriptional regulator
MYSREEMSEDILLHLLEGSKYGLEIKKEIEREREISIGNRSFYQILEKNRLNKLIKISKKRVISGRERFYYEIDDAGRECIREILAKRLKYIEVYKLQCSLYQF